MRVRLILLFLLLAFCSKKSKSPEDLQDSHSGLKSEKPVQSQIFLQLAAMTSPKLFSDLGSLGSDENFVFMPKTLNPDAFKLLEDFIKFQIEQSVRFRSAYISYANGDMQSFSVAIAAQIKEDTDLISSILFGKKPESYHPFAESVSQSDPRLIAYFFQKIIVSLWPYLKQGSLDSGSVVQVLNDNKLALLFGERSFRYLESQKIDSEEIREEMNQYILKLVMLQSSIQDTTNNTGIELSSMPTQIRSFVYWLMVRDSSLDLEKIKMEPLILNREGKSWSFGMKELNAKLNLAALGATIDSFGTYLYTSGKTKKLVVERSALPNDVRKMLTDFKTILGVEVKKPREFSTRPNKQLEEIQFFRTFKDQGRLSSTGWEIGIPSRMAPQFKALLNPEHLQGMTIKPKVEKLANGDLVIRLSDEDLSELDRVLLERQSVLSATASQIFNRNLSSENKAAARRADQEFDGLQRAYNTMWDDVFTFTYQSKGLTTPQLTDLKFYLGIDRLN